MLISDLLDLFAAISCGEEEEAEVQAEAAERGQIQNNQIKAGVIQRLIPANTLLSTSTENHKTSGDP